MQVSAKLADASRTIKASFFFGVKEIPNRPDVGSKVRLIGTHLQQWKQGGLQLCGKNIQFGESIVSMSLSNARTAWGIVKAAGAQSCFPKLSIAAVVIAWGRADTCRGSDMHLSAEFRDFDNVNCTIRGSFFFDPSKCPRSFDPGDVVQLVGVDIQEWNGLPQLFGRNVLITGVHK